MSVVQLELYAHLKCRVDNVHLFSAERKIREAMTKERDASDLEKLAHDGERNIHRLCDQLLVNGRQVRSIMYNIYISIILCASTERRRAEGAREGGGARGGDGSEPGALQAGSG